MMSPAENPLAQRNLPERVAEVLLSRITEGKMSLGSRIREVPLSEELGISRSTLREGLRLLEARGVVQSLPQKGSFVRSYDSRSIATIYTLREAAELRAASILFRAPDRIELLLQRVRPIIEEMARQEIRSIPALNKLDIEFHTSLVEAADDFALASIWSAVKHHLTIIFSLELVDGTGFSSDHERLVSALRQGDVAAFETEYRSHVAKDRLDVA
jgi:DNA-binding GntR family transcriptional regulator